MYPTDSQLESGKVTNVLNAGDVYGSIRCTLVWSTFYYISSTQTLKLKTNPSTVKRWFRNIAKQHSVYILSSQYTQSTVMLRRTNSFVHNKV